MSCPFDIIFHPPFIVAPGLVLYNITSRVSELGLILTLANACPSYPPSRSVKCFVHDLLPLNAGIEPDIDLKDVNWENAKILLTDVIVVIANAINQILLIFMYTLFVYSFFLFNHLYFIINILSLI